MNFRKSELGMLSRVVSHALRHEPWLYELELDEAGWVSMNTLISALRAENPDWSSLGPAHLATMIETSNKRRHEIEGERIRALYGHSIPQKLLKTPATPPARLFHGTSPEVAGLVRTEGLLPMSRQYVHMSADTTMAMEVGRRKSRSPIVLTIWADEAFGAGVRFYRGNDAVWLADSVPAAFIDKDGS